MATVRSQEAICSIVKKRTIKLKARREDVDYTGVALLNEDTLLVTDIEARNLQIYNRQDGERISASDRLEGSPWGVCVLSDSEVAVCLEDGKIVIMSLESIHGVKQVKTINVSRTGFYFVCESVAKWTPDKLLVSGRNVTGVMLCWCVVSVKDKSLVSTHDICKAWGGLTNLAVKGDTVYVSCPTSDSITSGVYAFDVFNPHKPKFLYQHQELNPGSIMADRDYVYVCDEGSKTIHQVNDLGQLVVIHTVSSDIYGIFYDDQRGVLYTTSWRSKGITVYKMDYPHQAGIPVEIMNMDDRSIQVFEDALKDGKETIYSIRILIVGHLNVGKSTLTRRLLGEEVDISERCSTEGINVHVNCCDVSLSTGEWKRREKDTEQDYKLQRLVKVFNENYQTSGSTAVQGPDAISPQQENTDQNPIEIDADYDKNTEILHQHSQHNIGQNLSSTASHLEEYSSTDVQSFHAQYEKDMMPEREAGEIHASESHKKDPLREMLKLLKDNKYKAKLDEERYAILTIWDFAGQYAFYTTHQMFLTRRAIYLMVSDVSEQFNDVVEDECYLDTKGKKKCNVRELVEIWMNSIHSCAASDNSNSAYSPTSSYTVIPPPVILVGTHVDKIPESQSLIKASKKNKPPQILKAEIDSSRTTAEPTHSREPLPLSNNQESLQKSTERLQRKRRATEGVFSASIQKGLPCSNPKLLYQVLYNLTQGSSDSRSTLERNCQNVGLQIHGQTPGNGNYFFEAVSSQLKRLNDRVQRSPHQLHQEAVAFLKANRILQVSAGNINFAEFMCNESFEEYCVRMEKDGEWADHVLVLAMARALQKDIMIVTSSLSSGSGDDNIAWVVGQDEFQGQPILLGHIWEHHYESLEPINPTHQVKHRKQAIERIGVDENNRQLDCHKRGQEYLRKIRSFLRGKPVAVHLVDKSFALDNSIVDKRLKSLKKKIIEVASQQPYWGEQIPTRWFLLEQQLMSLRDAGMKVISRSAVEQLNKEATVQIKDNEELDLFLKYLHETGTVVYFNIEILRDDIILDPQWLIYALKTLINAHPNPPKNPAENGSQSSSSTDVSQPQIPIDINAGNSSQTSNSTDSGITQKWCDFKEKGILTRELVDVIWTSRTTQTQRSHLANYGAIQYHRQAKVI